MGSITSSRLRRANLSITSICGNDGNCCTIEISSGYAIINVVRKAKIGDTVLISFVESWTSPPFRGKHLLVL